MNEQGKEIANRRPQSSGFVYTTNGVNHRISTRGPAANGLAAAASAVIGFIIGYIIYRKY
jgi:hypothetical protein